MLVKIDISQEYTDDKTKEIAVQMDMREQELNKNIKKKKKKEYNI